MMFSFDLSDILTAIVSALIGWLLAREKYLQEVRTMQAEEIAKGIEAIRILQERRDAYDDACVSLNDKLREFMMNMYSSDSLSEIFLKGILIRVELCEIFCNRVLREFLKYCEMQMKICHRDDAARSYQLREMVIPQMDQFRIWLDSINDPRDLKAFQRVPLNVARRTITPLNNLLVNYGGPDRSELEAELARVFAQLTQPGDYPPLAA